MKDYLITLITEKGRQIDDSIKIEGHYCLTWEVLINFICTLPSTHKEIKDMLIKIDFRNGDIFHYLRFLAKGMVGLTDHRDEVTT